MIALIVTVNIKPEHRDAVLKGALEDARGSQHDEPGCLRFDVIQDRDDPNRFYFYEIYRDEAALEAHRQTPHFKLYFEKVQPWLAAPSERRFGKNLVPSDAAWR